MESELGDQEMSGELKVSKISEMRDRADFRKMLALIIILGGGAFLWLEADPKQVVAYVFGLISVAVGYYFNTSQSSQDKTRQINDLTKKTES